MKNRWSVVWSLPLLICAANAMPDDHHPEQAAELANVLQTSEQSSNNVDALPEVIFCVVQVDGSIWHEPTYREADGSPCDRGGDCDNVEYACIEPSTEPDLYVRTNELESDIDCNGDPLVRAAFVIDGTGGELRYNDSSCLAEGEELRATLVAFSGGGGTVWRDAFFRADWPNTSRDPEGDKDPYDNDYRALELAGIRVVTVKWQTGVHRSIWDLGWITRSTPGPRTMQQMLEKPAALIRYVRANVEPGTKMGVAGTSAGGLQSASALVHDIGEEIDYLGLHAGGGLGVALPYSCGAINTPIRVNPFDGELCFLGGLCWLHGAAPMPPDVQAVWDYALDPASCTDGPAEALSPSSFASMEWAGAVPHEIGFIVNNGFFSDNSLGATWSAGMMRWLVYDRTGLLGQWANGGSLHGEEMASGNPSFALFKEQVCAALVCDEVAGCPDGC